MRDERRDRVREWIGPWMQNWPDGHPETAKRQRLRSHPLSASESAAAEARASTTAEQSGDGRIVQGEEAATEAAKDGRVGHLLFLATPTGYALRPCHGEPPGEGEVLVLDDGRRFCVLRHGPSPIPADRRRCVFLETLPGS